MADIQLARMRLGRSMEKFRADNFLSRQALATALGITERTVRNVENGSHVASYTTAKRFRDLVERYKKEGR